MTTNPAADCRPRCRLPISWSTSSWPCQFIYLYVVASCSPSPLYMFYLDYPNAISLLSYTLSRRFKSFYKAVIWIGMSARVGSGARVITGDELGLELRISFSPRLFRPTRVLALAFKHGPSLRCERNLGPLPQARLRPRLR
ncbi:hypothetical protein K523DRAFT_359021, partial [Schizophyllum commune Tattone D]